MKIRNHWTILFLTTLLFVACSDNENEPGPVEEDKPLPLKIGEVDTTFPKIKFKDHWDLLDVIEQPDGKILITGQFVFDNDFYDGNNRSPIARLNADGTRDTGFKDGIRSGVWYGTKLATQPDGKIIMAYVSTSSYSGIMTPRIMRFNSDGTEDESFQGRNLNFLKRYGHDGTSGSIHRRITDIKVMPDGKIFITGNFDTVENTLYPYIVRLHANGSVDNTFNFNSLVTYYSGGGYSGATYGHIGAVVLTGDKAVIGGFFVRENGANDIGYSVTRIESDGAVDASFENDQKVISPDCDDDDRFGPIEAITLQSDGKILIAGSFSKVKTTQKNFIARLQTNGELDAAFSADLLCEKGGAITKVIVLPDGKIFINWMSDAIILNPDGTTFETILISDLAHEKIDGAYLSSKGLIILGNFKTFNKMPTIGMVRIKL